MMEQPRQKMKLPSGGRASSVSSSWSGLLLLLLLGMILTHHHRTVSCSSSSSSTPIRSTTSSFHRSSSLLGVTKKRIFGCDATTTTISSTRTTTQQPSAGDLTMVPRGGSTATRNAVETAASTSGFNNSDDGSNTEVESNDDEDDIRNHPDYGELVKYRMEQQGLMELRSVFLSDALSNRGLGFSTVRDVTTPEGKDPPKAVDWDCALSASDNRKECIISHLAEDGTKVISAIDTDQEWVTLTELVKLRRSDPSKVNGLWHNKYSVLDGWFGPESDYSLLQHVGAKGLVLDYLLTGERFIFVMAIALVFSIVAMTPMLEYFVGRVVASGLFWSLWPRWRMVYRANLPMQLFFGQLAFEFCSKSFLKLASKVKQWLVLMECELMEDRIPLTVGVPDLVLDESLDGETTIVEESEETESEDEEEDENGDEDSDDSESDDDDEEEEE
mmetsp:Transcript_19786/g.47798  ORF Transcript_19786/g.47798 Transcript_19786/m.47798 type:complete len:444 (-) Transcript_19786:172-1503(-)